MNKKQAVIILTLLVLIICAGVVATKMNDNLYVNVDNAVGTEKPISTSLKATSDYFTQSRLEKVTMRNTAITSFKSLAETKNISAESKNNANAKAIKATENGIAEAKIETSLKGQGFTDVICWIEDDPSQVRISIKAKDAKDKLTDKQTRAILDVSTSLSHIKNIKLELKQ